MLLPKRVKFRKTQKGKTRGLATRGNKLSYGEYGLKALENGFVKSGHIEASRVVVARKLRGAGKMWINIFPHKPITKKPAETRMGKGKGNAEFWVAVVKPGRILFEIEGVTADQAKEAMRLAGHKLPISTRLVTRDHF